MSRFILLAALSLSTSSAFAAGQTDYALRPVTLEGSERRAVESDPRRLPRGVVGMAPASDGAPFVAMVEPGVYPVRDTREVQAALAEILPGLGVLVDVESLDVVVEGEEVPMVDLDVLYAEGELRTDVWLESVERRVGRLSEASAEMLLEEGRAVYEDAATPRTEYRFQQVVDGARAEARVIIVQCDDTGIRSISGALYDDTSTSNRVRLSGEEAARYAARYAAEIRGSVPDAPELVAVPDGSGLRLVYRALVETIHGDYDLDVDAERGIIVQVNPRFHAFTAGEGAVAVPDVPATFDVLGFNVNDASGCNYTLDHTGVVTMSNNGADGFTGDVTACNVGGVADFDVAPINGTANVMVANGANYNPRFSHVNAYAWVYETLDWFESRGSGNLPAWTVTVNDTNVCGFGADNACGNTGMLVLGIGLLTLSDPDGGLFNTALDAAVIAHEVGHGLNNIRYSAGGGVQNPSNAEGLSDYWAFSLLDDPRIAVVARNTTADVETGWLPRAADGADVFPEHVTNFNQRHANGQVIARALWESRQEMDARSPIGAMMNDKYLMAAIPQAGVGQSASMTELSVHNAFQGILVNMLVQAGSSYPAGDVIVGFAKAGLMVSPKESAIDISEDVIDADETTPPTFQVWTGQDYVWSGSATTAGAPYNTRYEIEVANDAGFTQNVVTSGTQSNIAVSGGVATGSWQLAQDDWNTLRKGNAIYFRVTSWTPNDNLSVRTSDHWFEELAEIAPGRAVINHTNQGSACNTASTGAMASAALVAGLAAAMRRRRSA